MKIRLRSFMLTLIIFVSSNSFAQYKYDIGLRASSYDLERFQLDARFHFNSPYSLLFSVGTGSRGNLQYIQSAVYDDSLVNISQSLYTSSNNVFKIGVQRKLGFLATNVFYAGATVGIGFDQQVSSQNTSVYVVETDSDGNVIQPFYPTTQLYSTHAAYRYQAINAQLALSFGMDVPISKRFSINAELGFAGIYRSLIDIPSSVITLHPSVSGGLRYAFGKRE